MSRAPFPVGLQYRLSFSFAEYADAADNRASAVKVQNDEVLAGEAEWWEPEDALATTVPATPRECRSVVLWKRGEAEEAMDVCLLKVEAGPTERSRKVHLQSTLTQRKWEDVVPTQVRDGKVCLQRLLRATARVTVGVRVRRTRARAENGEESDEECL